MTTEHLGGGIVSIGLSGNVDSKNARGEHAVELKSVATLSAAVLFFAVEMNKRGGIRRYKAGIEGCTVAGTPGYARVDLTPAAEGDGICRHALLHCHVGRDPESEDGPETRVPLPFLMPEEAIAWLLATVHPALEPPG